MKRALLPPILAALLVLDGCGRPEATTTTLYDTAPATRRDIVVAVEAAGQIEPSLTVELKSKASGQILEINGETGQVVEAGTLLVQIDKRNPRNSVAQAQATLEAAKARRSIAEAQSRRAAELHKEKIINEVDLEQAQLEFANAKAEVVRSQVAVETAKIQLDDTDLRAPITGTIIEKLVEEGQVISSPIMDVGGGTLMLKMADLSRVQVRTLVDETDIGKITPGQPAEVTVTAFPNQPFRGSVLKIEPQANQDETVTTFAVLIVLDNERGLLKPGMNADVAILVTERKNVLAIPTAALRTPRDIATSAGLVGLDEATVRAQLKEHGLPGSQLAKAPIEDGEGAAASAGGTQTASTPPAAAPRGAPGNTAAPAAGAQATDAASAYRFGNRYWVFVKRDGKPVATEVSTGVTDLDYNEVVAGLSEGDEVYLLPSSGLVETQQRFQQQMRQFTGMPGMNRSSSDRQSQSSQGR